MIATHKPTILIHDGMGISFSEWLLWNESLRALFERSANEKGVPFDTHSFKPFDANGSIIRFLLANESFMTFAMATCLIQEEQTGCITSLYVAPGYRGQQFGEILHSAVVAETRRRQIISVNRQELFL